MNTLTHSTPEDIMSFLDGELPTHDAEALSTHLDHCEACANIAEQFRATSESLSRWTLPQIPIAIENSITAAIKPEGPRLRENRNNLLITHFGNWKLWAIGTGGAAFVVALLITVTALPHREGKSDAKPSQNATMALTEPKVSDYIHPKSSYRYAHESKKESPEAAQLSTAMDTGTTYANEQGSTYPDVAPPPPPPPVMKMKLHSGLVTGGHLPQPASAPMIARTISLALQVKSLDTARTALDAILTRHHGYSAQLTASTAENSARTLQASLRIPAPELAAALADLKTLGRIQTESQSGEEVTQQHADLVARLNNARESETRLRAILQQRTGKVSDVLEVEEEITRVRGEIETMQAEQQTLEHRVDFATADIQLSEEFKARLDAPADSVSTRMSNAFVAGYHNATETLLGFILFFEEFAPTILIWLIILCTPVFFAWRRYRKSRQNSLS